MGFYRFFPIVFILLFCRCLFTQAQEYYIRLNLCDDNYYQFYLADKPRINYEKDTLIISVDSIDNKKSIITKIEVPVSLVDNLVFLEDNQSAITETAFNSIRIKTIDNCIELTNTPPESSFYVYDIKGVLMIAGKSSVDGYVKADIGSIGNGIYIVRVSNLTLKILKK